MENLTNNISGTTNNKIRRQFDEKLGKWYFSIVDVLAITTKSSDPRNYWKVLKNRLKKTHNELVTKCNQLKMKARDGKYYFTDTADSETIVEIVDSIPKASVEVFKLLVRDIEDGISIVHQSPNQIHLDEVDPLGESEISSPETKKDISEESSDAESELLVDTYQTASEIFIIAMVAGIYENSLNINLINKKINISGQKIKPVNQNGNYLCEELVWTTFSRTISLPALVQHDSIEKNFENGKLVIRLIKIIK